MPASVRHTFLFEPAQWAAEGVFTDAAGRMSPMRGSSLILHTDRSWILEGRVYLQGAEPMEFSHTYNIVPFSSGAHSTTWNSHNPVLGSLIGAFTKVGDLLLSIFHSKDGCFTGSEWLRQMGTDRYENRGVCFEKDRLLSAWATNLTRQK
jgi:hypothetical protein